MMVEFKVGDPVTWEAPKKAKPIDIAIEEPLDVLEIGWAYRNKEHFAYVTKRRMAAKLAQRIVEECQLFEAPSYEQAARYKRIRMELTINDRGRYENWLKEEWAEGFERGCWEGLRKGYEGAMGEIPYGLELERYYE